MKPGQAIHIQLSDVDGNPLPIENIYVIIYLFTVGNFRYAFEAGRTDIHGQLMVTYDSLEAQRHENGAFFLMDYNTPLEDCDPVAKLVVDSEQDLRRKQKEALQTWDKEPTWAAPWPSNLLIGVEPTTVDLRG